jgi:hypothetical protein
MAVQSLHLGCRSRKAIMTTLFVFGMTPAPAFAEPVLQAQVPPTATTPAITSPEPIYWKQNLFQIPYQWGSASEPGAAQLVVLYVSKDRGISWQRISEARPNVTSFNYRAEGEGEYWFAVRTLDQQGQSWPSGELSPEIRVVVDTTMPVISHVRASRRPDGTIEIERAGFDQNLDSTTWRFEIQAHPAAPWQPVSHLERQIASSNLPEAASGVGTSRAELQLPPGQSAVAVRATVLDRAGNLATFHTTIEPQGVNGPAAGIATDTTMQQLPNMPVQTGIPNPAVTNPFVYGSQQLPPPVPTATQAPAAAAFAAPPPVGWTASSTVPSAADSQPAQLADQPWHPNTTAHAPFTLWNGSPTVPGDTVTTYGNPTGIAPPTLGGADTRAVAGHANSDAQPPAADDSQPASPAPSVQPLGPFRQASIARSASPSDSEPLSAGGSMSQFAGAAQGSAPNANSVSQLPPGVQLKLVGSRTFALEYELDHAGGRGVASVELWGTRDGGQTWRAYNRDDDNRSPLIVTVDDEGQFGFRLVVDGSGEAPSPRPAPGDSPELWVAVDLNHPTAELTAIEPGNGNLADHLIFRWRADDDNLEQRPISFFYSSHPVGPWSAIATNLENTGQYAWRVERHVPTRFYVRLEARDSAGNLAVFQTRDPIEFTPPATGGRLRSAEPIDPTATGAGSTYR